MEINKGRLVKGWGRHGGMGAVDMERVGEMGEGYGGGI
jgi:hypothetical protein